MKEGVAFVKKVESELAAECKAQGLDKSAAEALACYHKNKSKAGFRVFNGCDEEPGKKLVATVVAKHNGE